MSQLLIQQYLNQLAILKKVSGTQRESVVREAFKDLLKWWAKSHDLVFIPEYRFADFGIQLLTRIRHPACSANYCATRLAYILLLSQ